MKTIASPKTTDLRVHRTWVDYNGTVCRVVGKYQSVTYPTLLTVSLDRYNMSGMKLANVHVDVSRDREWIEIATPKM